MVGEVAGDSVLDLGCGQGAFAFKAAKRRYNLEVTAVDPNEKVIAYINRALLTEPVEFASRINVICGDGNSAELNDKTFDTVAMGHVLGDVNNPREIIEQSYRMLNNGGSLIVTVPLGDIDHHDHHNFFLPLGLLELLTPYYALDKLEIDGEMICFVGKKSAEGVDVTNDFDQTDKLQVVDNSISEVESFFHQNIRECKAAISRHDNKLKTQLPGNGMADNSKMCNGIKRRIFLRITRSWLGKISGLVSKMPTRCVLTIAYIARDISFGSGKRLLLGPIRSNAAILFARIINALLVEGATEEVREFLDSPYYKDTKYLELKRRVAEIVASRSINFAEIKPAEYASKYNRRVLFVVHNSKPFHNAGYAVRTHNIVRSLTANDVKLDVVTRLNYPWDLNGFECRKREDRSIVSGVAYHRIVDLSTRYGASPDSKYISVYGDNLASLAEKYDNSVIHASSNFINPMSAVYAGKKLGLPVVNEIRGLWFLSQIVRHKQDKKNDFQQYNERMEKVAALSSHAVVTLSNSLKEEIASWGVDRDRIWVVPNCVDLNKFRPTPRSKQIMSDLGIPDNAFVIGYFGSMTNYEGVEDIIEAVRLLAKRGIDIILLLAGGGYAKNRIAKIAQSKLGQENLRWLGYIPFRMMNQYYSILDLCAFPRFDLPVCRLVTPLKPMEAMASKVPVIVSDLPALREIVEDGVTGILSPPENAEKLAESILRVYEDKDMANLIKENAYQWVLEKRDWGEVSKRYIELYKSL